MLPQPEPKPNIIRRIIGLVVLMATIVALAMLFLYGFAVDTIFFHDIAPYYSNLPAGAQNDFASVESYFLTTAGLEVAAILFLAVIGTIAAIFGLQSHPESPEEY